MSALARALAFVATVASAASKDPAQAKLEQMEALESRSMDSIIYLNAREYMDLVIENPRPYHVVMLYTVTNYCEHCQAMFPEFQTAVYSFKKQEEKLEVKTFYCVLYHTQETSEFFKAHQFNTVPYITVSLMQQKRDQEQPFYKEEDIWYVRPDQVYDANTIITFMNKRMVTTVELKLPFTTVLFTNTIFFSIVVGLLIFVRKMYDVLVKPFTWYLLAMAVFFICTGGVIHTILHWTPWFKFVTNEFGQQVVGEYFMRGQRGQWAGEGYIVSTLTTLCGLSATLIAITPQLNYSEAQKRLIVMFSLIALMVLVQCILECYRIKAPWYGPTFFPPQSYLRGPLAVDQGNNI